MLRQKKLTRQGRWKRCLVVRSRRQIIQRILEELKYSPGAWNVYIRGKALF